MVRGFIVVTTAAAIAAAPALAQDDVPPSVSTAATFDAEDVDGMPSVSSDPRDIVRLVPFAETNLSDFDALTFAGTSFRLNAFEIDGVRQGDLFGANSSGYVSLTRSPISPDAIEAIEVDLTPFDASHGDFQGARINVLTKSGRDEIFGSLSYLYTGDELRGDQNAEREFDYDFTERTFAATLGGPLIKDKLRFFAAYDAWRRDDPILRGPEGVEAFTTFDRISFEETEEIHQAYFEEFGITTTGYGEAPTGAEDTKWLFRLDADFSERHRAAFTYNSQRASTIVQDPEDLFGSPERTRIDELPINQVWLRGPSSWFDRIEEFDAYSLRLASEWTDAFSTEFSLGYVEQSAADLPLDGSDQPYVRLLGAFSGDYFFGSHVSKHANERSNDRFDVSLSGDYSWGRHTFSAGAARAFQDVYNLDLDASDGIYVAIFEDEEFADPPVQLIYNNHISNDERQAAADFSFAINSLFVQDTWAPTPSLTLTGGLRYDWYETGDRPDFSAFAFDRLGVRNDVNIDGLDIVSPRFGFAWEPEAAGWLDGITIRGGAGRFAGGLPMEWISSTFTDASSVDTAFLSFDELPTFDPTTIPQSALDDVAAGEGYSLVYLDPDFEIPSIWRYRLSAEKEFDLPFLNSNGWRIGLDYIYSDYDDQPAWRDPWCEVIAAAPDGRPIYGTDTADGPVLGCNGVNLDVVSGVLDPDSIGFGSVNGGIPLSNVTYNAVAPRSDLALSSVDAGESHVWSVILDKNFENGIDFVASYTHSDVEDVGYGASATPQPNRNDSPTAASPHYSQFGSPAQNGPVSLGVSDFEIEHAIKFSFGWSGELVDGYESRVRLFGERRSGQPLSYGFRGEGGMLSTGFGPLDQSLFINNFVGVNGLYATNADIFGVDEQRANDGGSLLYVPATDGGSVTATSDPNVVYDEDFDLVAFNQFLQDTGLIRYAGGIAPRNAFRSRWTTRFDLRIAQDFPVPGPSRFAPGAFGGNERATFFIDIENIGNLLNDEWGAVRTIRHPRLVPVVESNLIVDGQYYFNEFVGDAELYDKSFFEEESLWRVQLGLRYAF